MRILIVEPSKLYRQMLNKIAQDNGAIVVLVQQAKEALAGSNIIGVILNGIQQVPGQRYGNYGYYGHRKNKEF